MRENQSDPDDGRKNDTRAFQITGRLAQNDFTGSGSEASRAESLMQMQRTHGNAYVNEFIGNEVIAVRGHNSPPATGPGSHGEPILKGGKVLNVAAMKTDAYHASPVNPHNPIVVWTDGTNLFFAPSQEQLTLGRILPMPEPAFVPVPGFTAEEILWDRGTDSSGSGSLVVVARKTGVADIQVAVLNTLEQVSSFLGPGLTSSAKSHVAREGGQFLAADESNVPIEISGGLLGPINSVVFPDGFFRYRAASGDHDLYVAQGADPFAHIVERADGNITQTFASGTIAAVVPESNGVVHLETSSSGVTVKETTSVDLRTSPPKVGTVGGHASSEVGYDDAKKRLMDLGIDITENGVRFHVSELEAIENALNLGGGQGLTALQEFSTIEATGPIILEISKSIGSDSAGGLAGAGSGIPLLFVREPFASSETARVSTIRHETTHVIMGALEVVRNSKLTARERANLEGSLRWEARQALKKAKAGLLRMGEVGAGAPRHSPGNFSDWRTAIGEDPQIANLWIELLRRYSFIPDPEGTGELRGVSLADESRYSGMNDPLVGHPADGADEFVASFVTSATLFRAAFIAAMVEAQTAGNAHGGGGGTYLRKLYSQAWDLISTRYVPLGPNPF